MATDERANTLRAMQICRFCLDDKGLLTNIYEKDGKQSVPLPLQVMACVAIEVFKNDGMPQLICSKCRSNTQQAYNFKATCKKSDDALKLYLATGELKALQKVHKEGHKEVKVQIVARKRPSDAIKEASAVDDKRPKTETIMIVNKFCDDDRSQSPGTVELELQSSMNCEEYDQSSSDENPEDEVPIDEDKINPTLKVSQVKTDVFPCSVCERSFPLKQLLDLHMKNHVRERSYECGQCGRRFFTKYDLGKHVQTHSDDRPFECVVCTKSFSRESLLHRHEKTHNDVPKYLCSFCDRTFLTREDLDMHSEKHKKKRPYSCHICQKSFVFKQGLERHEASHIEEKPHKCNYCEASFTSPIKLMRHITSHAGLRPYPCKICSRTFLLSHHLTRHMRSHYASKNSDIQPNGQHKCDICSMSFRRKDSLINHSTIHSMVNLKCVICYTTFDNAKQVMNHITTHLSGLPYPCDKCDYSFESPDQLEEHELKHAEMEYEDLIEQEVSQEELSRGVEDQEDDQGSDDGDIVEFTITNDEDPEVVPRPRRAPAPKIKNYAQFLKEELGSDVEDELIHEHHGDDGTQDEELDQKPGEESIKPIIRSEGTKVYGRKNPVDRPKFIPIIKPTQSKSSDDINQKLTIENLGLTQQDLQALPNKQYVDMKIGDKTVRVQKLMMTKAEIEQMAKQGKIEMKGDTILLRKTPLSLATTTRQMPFRHTMESIIDSVKPNTIQKQIIKKTYVKKPMVQQQEPLAVAKEEEVESSQATGQSLV